MDVTPWLAWFPRLPWSSFRRGRSNACRGHGQGAVLGAAPDAPFNDRQRAIINRLLNGFEGKLTSSKWALLVKCSQDTALRDIDDLIARGVLAKDAAGGRSTSYSLLS